MEGHEEVHGEARSCGKSYRLLNVALNPGDPKELWTVERVNACTIDTRLYKNEASSASSDRTDGLTRIPCELSHPAPYPGEVRVGKRPSMDQVFMRFAFTVAERSVCTRQVKVGCIITDREGSSVLGIGYNGPARGLAHDCSPVDSSDPQAYCMCGHKKEQHFDLGPCDWLRENVKTEGCTSCECTGFRNTAPPGSCTCIHAEVNALLKAPYIGAHDLVMYTTLEPCITCARLILNSNVRTLVYHEVYRTHAGIDLLHAQGVRIEHLTGATTR